MIQVLTMIALAELALCAALSWTFIILYSRVRWYNTAEGRHLMKFTLAFALTISLTLLFRILRPPIEVRAVLSIALFGWIAWEMGNRIRLHLRAKRETRSDERQTVRDNARDALRDGPRDEARDIAHDEQQRLP